MNVTFRRIAAGAALAIAPALLAVGVAASSQASSVVPNPGPTVFAGQDHTTGGHGVNGTNIKPGTPEHHHHQNQK